MLVELFLLPLVTARNVFVSSPFDNFRMECPKRAAAVDLSIRMVESVGAKRQDVVFDMTCEGVDELYPWVNIPVGISEMEREDCYYSAMLDPILDETTDFTCKHREYMAGITRLTDTRIQILCCRLRTRDEFSCQEMVFNKPVGLSKSTIIEHENQLINAIRVEDKAYVVRFCDLSPRNTADIYDDIKMKTTTHHRHHVNTHSTPKPYAKVGKKIIYPSVDSSALVSQRPTPLPLIPSPTTTSTMAFRRFTTSKPTSTTSTSTRALSTSASPPHFNAVLANENSVVEIDDMNMAATVSLFTTTLPSHSIQPPQSQTFKIVPTTYAPVTQRVTTPEINAEQSVGAVDSVKQEVKDDESVEPPTNGSSTNVEDIIRRIQGASSQSAEKLFKETIASLLSEEKLADAAASINSNTDTSTRSTSLPPFPQPTESSTPVMGKNSENQLDANEVPENSIEDITVNDLSRITFRNEDFPKSNERKFAIPAKLKVSKTDLPLKIGASADDFVFLRPINAEGHRRAPIQTHRPHVEIWSSEEDESGATSLEQTTVYAPKVRKIKKLPKKVIRAYRLLTTAKPVEDSTDYKVSSEERAPAFGIEAQEGTLHVDITTTSSPRRDLSPSRKVVESMVHKMDNAHSIDEETNASPFEDEDPSIGFVPSIGKIVEKERNFTMKMSRHLHHSYGMYKIDYSLDGDITHHMPSLTYMMVTNGIQQNIGSSRILELKGNEDIEEVIMKLSAGATNIRRAPVRDIIPKEQNSDKNADDSKDNSSKANGSVMKRKDGNKTHIPKRLQPIPLPEMTIFERQHKEDIIVEEMMKNSQGVDAEKENTAEEDHNNSDEQAEVTENLVLVNSKSFVGDYVTTPAQETAVSFTNVRETAEFTTVSNAFPTTEYDPASFYYTPVPKPHKKEKILTFCTKDVALRDSRNMVIACGGDEDVWYPTRCPQGSDCFLSQDSTYRLCCPVSKG